MSESSYIPGVCNINRAEIAYRRKAMWFGIVVSVIVFAVLLVMHASWWLSIVLFIPVYIAAIGYLQVTQKFCVSYGSSGRQNADDGSSEANEVTEKEALEADKAKTKRMNLQAFAASLAILAVSSIVLYVV